MIIDTDNDLSIRFLQEFDAIIEFEIDFQSITKENHIGKRETSNATAKSEFVTDRRDSNDYKKAKTCFFIEIGALAISE